MITKIELKPHPCGYRIVDGVEEVVENDFWTLMVDDADGGNMRQAGYVSKAEGSGIALIRRFDPMDVDTIHNLVNEAVGERPRPNQPPEIPDDSEPEEDDEDDE